jgi:dihydrofolate synthase/folylpolyglutamate synthase
MNLTYPQAIDFLFSLRLFGTKMGLENPRRLAALAGNPQRQLQFIHVAGTNGKGSTCAMLESIYRAAGLRVGLFTSPHLVSFRERIQVNRSPISESDVVRLIGDIRGWVRDCPPEVHPTFFEVVTVMALRYFAEQACGLVVWETGLGGRLDATNIVTPLASVITNIQFDHEKWLGSTLAEIAAEKAGIIKQGVPALTASTDESALNVIRKTAARLKAPLTVVAPAETTVPPLGQIGLPLLGKHQRINAALGLATVRALGPQIQVDDRAIRLGLETVRWSGRLQLVRLSPHRTILLDGAHNPAGAETLRDALQSHFPERPRTIVLGILQDKDWNRMCEIIVPLASRMLLAPVGSERTAAPEQLAQVCRALAPSIEVTSCASLNDAMNRAQDDAFVVIAGSLHFVGEAMELLQVVGGASERNLNEWDASASGHLCSAPAAATVVA